MSDRFFLTESASEDLRHILSYLAERSEDAPIKVAIRLEEEMQDLAEMPTKGHWRDDVPNRSFRFWSVYSYLIVYRWETRPLEIVRILHGAQNVPRQLPRV